MTNQTLGQTEKQIMQVRSENPMGLIKLISPHYNISMKKDNKNETIMD